MNDTLRDRARATVRITPRLSPWAHRPSHARAAASRAEGASPRARVPPVDYRDKLQPSPWDTFAPPRRYIFTPPLTRPWSSADPVLRSLPKPAPLDVGHPKPRRRGRFSGAYRLE